jgi:hypothetical protein
MNRNPDAFSNPDSERAVVSEYLFLFLVDVVANPTPFLPLPFRQCTAHFQSLELL